MEKETPLKITIIIKKKKIAWMHGTLGTSGYKLTLEC